MLPKVVIVGRPNVGKSSLLNMFANRRISIVDPTPGVTRDRISTTIELPAFLGEETPPQIELIDTGGYGIEDSQDLTIEVEQQIANAIAEAHLILFVIDAQAGIVPLDITVAQLLREGQGRRGEADILLIANKVDNESLEADAFEAMELGFGEPLMVSATNRYNKAKVLKTIRDHVDFKQVAEQSAKANGGAEEKNLGPLIAIIGKRNAGKSTLVNALAGEARMIVSNVEGTTRDSVDVRFEMGEHIFTAIDTAGVRKVKSIKTDIEYYSYHRALRSIRRADITVILIDASVPISQVDKQLAMEIQRHFKPVIIAINKWDLAEKNHTQEEYVEYLDKALRGLSYAPIIFLSALENKGVKDIIKLILNLHNQVNHRISTGKLNTLVRNILAERGPTSGVGKRPKIYYVTQLETAPPTIGLFVNDPTLFNPNYLRFFMNRLRDHVPFSEIPIKILIRERKRMPFGATVEDVIER